MSPNVNYLYILKFVQLVSYLIHFFVIEEFNIDEK